MVTLLLWNLHCDIVVVESIFWQYHFGIAVVASLLSRHQCGIVMMASLLWHDDCGICDGIVMHDGVLVIVFSDDFSRCFCVCADVVG